MTEYRASVILGRGFIGPVSLDALAAREGKCENLHPYNVLRKTIYLHPTEQAALSRGDAARRLDPALYGKAVISRSLFRNGQAPRFLRLGGGGSEVMTLSLARPSEMLVHDDTGLFRLALLSDIQDARPPNLFSADPSMSDIALAYRTSAGTILLEVLSDGRIRLHILSQGRDPVSQPPGSPAQIAQAAGFTLRPLCQRGLNGAALEHCPDGRSGTIFRVSYVTDRTHR